ncbi:hypothetical protein PHYBOEH_004354 [Phytophthora boehmeriae]|uniref:RING-type domain-containing protein n=1 Tax=Phytophthora boehmeriae TaxID=109152 RepID=A0A8T1WM97_9STRA|nr:hypothetical protein PHYBOEH_004354 [Phytophthora boehmeriae]
MSSKRLRKKRSLPAGPLPAQVSWLENVSMDVTPLSSRSRTSCRRVDYLLTVTYQPRGAAETTTWQFIRTFDAFRFFRKRLVAALQRGHFCHAECPWLYTFLKSYFPKSQLVGSTLSRVVARRRKTLTRSLATIRSFLLKRSNHSCHLVMEGVARELLEFVVKGASEPENEQQGEAPECLRMLLLRWQNGEMQLVEASSSSDDTTPCDDDTGPETEICAVCEASLMEPLQHDREINDDRWDCRTMISTFSTLDCGHNFHDECLVEKLNEELKCPTCGHQETS